MPPKNRPPLERRAILATAAEFRMADGENGPILSGYAAKFATRSEDLGGFVETIRAGAFTDAIAECDVRALVDHNPTLILGRNKAGTLRLTEDEVGLHYECDLPDTQAGRDIATSIKRGDVTGCSFGFITVEDEWKTEEGFALRELIRVHLFDVSAVTFPAYPDTEVGVRSLAAYRESLKPKGTPRLDALNRWLKLNDVR
jgi:HK97 family phage prohead protease